MSWRTGVHNQTTNLLPLGTAVLGSPETPFNKAHVNNLNVYDSENIVSGSMVSVNGSNSIISLLPEPSYPKKWELSLVKEMSGMDVIDVIDVVG